MKSATNWRYAVLALLVAVAAFCILSEPDENVDFSEWLCVFVCVKALGFGIALLIIRLVRYWESEGTIDLETNEDGEELR